jgi:hypothetical protein
MSCCGEKRSKIYHDPYSHSGADSGANAGQPVQETEVSYFKYNGATPAGCFLHDRYSRSREDSGGRLKIID